MNNAEVLVKFKADDTDVEKKTSNLSNKLSGLAKGLAIGAAAVGTAAVATTKALINGATATAQYGDEIDKTSQKIGFGTEAYQKWDYAMQIAGTSMKDCSIGLKTMTNKIDDALNGSSNAIGMFEKLGISVDDLKGKTREDIFGMVVSGLQNTTDELTKAAIANDVFGRSGQELMPLFNETTENTQKLLEEAEKYGMVMSESAVKNSANFNDSLTKMQKTIGGVKNALLGELLPGFSTLMDGISGLVAGQDDAGEKVAEGITNVVETISKVLPKIVEVVGNLIPKLIPVVGEILTSVSQALLDNLPTIIQGILKLLPGLLKAVVMIIEGIIKALPDIILILAEMLPELLPTIIEAILEIIPMLIDNLPLFIKAGIQLIIGLVEGILKSIPKVLEIIPKLIKSIFDFFKQVPSMMKDVGGNLIKGLWEGIKNLGSWILDRIKGLGKSILNTVKGIFGIHSPSTEFAIIGRYNMLGLEKGMEDMAPEIQKDIDGMFDLSPSMASSMNNTLSPVINVYNDINMKQDTLGQLVNDIKTFSGGSKQDYNYGAGV